jgi:hypothetical protein
MIFINNIREVIIIEMTPKHRLLILTFKDSNTEAVLVGKPEGQIATGIPTHR